MRKKVPSIFALSHLIVKKYQQKIIQKCSINWNSADDGEKYFHGVVTICTYLLTHFMTNVTSSSFFYKMFDFYFRPFFLSMDV